MMKTSFKVNDYISLDLEDGKINILVVGEEFITCKGIVINIPFKKLYDIREYPSIDYLVSKFYKIIEEVNEFNENEITLETEFLVHCSNLQAWAENGYDTRLLHSDYWSANTYFFVYIIALGTINYISC